MKLAESAKYRSRWYIYQHRHSDKFARKLSKHKRKIEKAIEAECKNGQFILYYEPPHSDNILVEELLDWLRDEGFSVGLSQYIRISW